MTFRIVCLFSFALIVSGCTTVYVPNTPNATLFTGKGEFQGSLHFMNGVDLHTAYAISNNIGIMANGSVGSSGAKTDTTTYHRRKYGELALGYYSGNDQIYFEVYGGLGQGEATSSMGFEFFGSDKVQATGTFTRYFFQPSIGVNKANVGWAFTPRISYVNFTKFESGSSNINFRESPEVFFEPSITVRTNISNQNRVSIFGHTGIAAPINERNVFFDYRFFYISTGIGINLGRE